MLLVSVVSDSITHRRKHCLFGTIDAHLMSKIQPGFETWDSYDPWTTPELHIQLDQT